MYYVGNSIFVRLQIDRICGRSDKHHNILSKQASGSRSRRTAKQEIHASGIIKLGHLSGANCS